MRELSAPYTRVQAPEGFNYTPETFKRRMTDKARDADPWHKPEKKRGGWRYPVATVIACAAVVIFMTGCDQRNYEDFPIEKVSLAAKQACDGATAIWVDSATIECVKEMK